VAAMKDILLIAHFSGGDNDSSRKSRFNYLADAFTNDGLDTELLTSNFSHTTKTKRIIGINNHKYRVTLLEEPGYRNNVSVKRVYSHYIMGRNLEKYLEKRKKPDLIYCSVPSLDLAKAAAKYAKKNGIRFIIDIQDLWPEAYKIVFHLPLISDILFYPMKRQADYIYAAADEIVAVSQTYADRALSVNKKNIEAHSVFLGTELAAFDKMCFENKPALKPDDEIWLAYIGTLGHSYDLICVIDALKILQDMGVKNIKFIVMGHVPLRLKFEEHAKENDIHADFKGALPYAEMAGILKACDIAVNPIVKRAPQSIINKHGDYAAAGLPVINTQECEEYRNLIEEYNAGLNCENNNPADLAKKLQILCEDKELRKKMGSNSRRLAEDKFDRSRTYPEIVALMKK
jgi:glycosyltransferase involved in cell wall biosynthesis